MNSTFYATPDKKKGDCLMVMKILSVSWFKTKTYKQKKTFCISHAHQYYGHREKLRLVGRETDIEKLNRTALRIAREVATETGTLMAGNICNSTIFTPNDLKVQKEVYNMFKVTTIVLNHYMYFFSFCLGKLSILKPSL